MWRDIYRLMLTPELFLDADNLRELISRAGLASVDTLPAQGTETIDTLAEYLVQRAHCDETELRSTIEAVAHSENKGYAVRSLFAHGAPMASALGGWLQGLSCPANFEDEVQLKTLALLADDIGVGKAGRSRTDGFRQIARSAGLTEVAGEPHELVADRNLRDGAFRFPALVFTLSRRSDAFMPEIAGLDFALRTIGLLPVWRVLSGYMDDAGWERLDLAVPQTDALPPGHSPVSLSRHILDRYADPNTRHRSRIKDGMIWAINALATDMAEFDAVVKLADDPVLAMARLVQERAAEAAIYHHGFELEGKSLNAWFTEAKSDPLPLVDALSRSRLVRPGEPDRSMLLGSLLRPDGRMFRIFLPEDIGVIRRWILVLPEAKPSASPASSSASSQTGTTAPEHRRKIEAGNASLGAVPEDIRDAYHLLQGRALAPRTRNFALGYARFWLSVARRSIDASSRSLPATWQPGILRHWLLDAHASHDQAFQRSEEQSMPSREKLVDETLQLAPLTLIDGSWLQGFSEVAYASSAVGAPLFRIYWDELGNGDWSINHPKIYRDLLASMGIEVAPTGSREFAQDRRIREESLRLPVFWLCLGKLPATLRPEILGLNLAMELSGVGGSYRTARKVLKHYGFSTHFVDLHNTIDNVSTGHSAWAADAIDAHMAVATKFVDEDDEWERIRVGYEALAPITKRSADLDFFKHQKRPWGARTRRESSYA
jgi:hypothetical protein